MGNRFSEISNAKWCKLCNANVIDGQDHPDTGAHAVYEEEQERLSSVEAKTAEKLNAVSSLIPVSSNDMLEHIAQPGSPETLCGRLITDRYRPSTTDLVCDICARLSSAASFLINSETMLGSLRDLEPEIDDSLKTASNYTRDGYRIDDDGFTVVTNSEVDSESEYDYNYFGFDPDATIFTYERFANNTEFELEIENPTEQTEEAIYLGSEEDNQPIQFTAHWLEEDNEEEPLFLPNDEL